MPNAALLDHAKTQFHKSVVSLAPGMWTAVGYAASTQHMIEGDTTVTAPFMGEPRTDSFNATRDPEEHHVEGIHDGYFDDGHPHCDDV